MPQEKKQTNKVTLTTFDGKAVEAFAPVIVSASRATDIPAFYTEWFFKRLDEGYSVWKNPFNGVSSYVAYQNTRFIVFWSKNPFPLLQHLDELERHMLRMIGYGENLGSGFPMILSAWKEAGWGEPILDNRLDVDEVALVLPIKRIEGSGPKSGPKSGPQSGPKNGPKNRKSDPKKLSPQERLDMIIAIIKNNPRITRKDIEDMLGVGHTTIQNDLRILKEQYGVRYEGPSKTGKWVIDK